MGGDLIDAFKFTLFQPRFEFGFLCTFPKLQLPNGLVVRGVKVVGVAVFLLEGGERFLRLEMVALMD